MEIAIVIVCVAFLSWFFYRLSLGRKMMNEKRELLDAAYKKDPSEYTETDRQLLLENLEKHRAHFTAREYDILKSRYSGEESVLGMAIKYGVDSPNMSVRERTSVEKAQAQKESTKTIVKDAVVGGIVAGPAGAEVVAIEGKNKEDND